MIGLSFWFETYSSPASINVFALLDELPLPLTGQKTWALGFFIPALVVFIPQIVVRVVGLVLLNLIWAFLFASYFYETLLGPVSARVGSAATWMSLTIVISCFLAIQRLPDDMPRRSIDAGTNKTRRG